MARLSDKARAALDYLTRNPCASDGQVGLAVGIRRESVNRLRRQNHAFATELERGQAAATKDAQASLASIVDRAILRVDKALDDPRSAESLRVALGVLAKVGTLEAKATSPAPLDDLNECIREISLAVEAAARVIALGLVDPPPDILEAFKKAVGAAEGALDGSGSIYSELLDRGVAMPGRALEF